MNLRFKKFQLEDIARAALLDGVIFSWDPGLGKTLAALAWALIKNCRRVLLVVPGQLHRHFSLEAYEHFNLHLTPLRHRRELRSFGLDKAFNKKLATRFFITSYQDLGFNNTRDGSPTLSRSIAKLIAEGAGFDTVIVDEGTRLQSTETHIANGVRYLNPTYRMVLTGTPVKNRLESFFWLGWWAAGGPPLGNALWPYPGTNSARELFAKEHLMMLQPVEGGRSIRTARITNLHDLWTLIAPLTIRRRKAQCGEEIPPKIVRPIWLQPGTIQNQVYRNHLFYPPVESAQGREVRGFSQVAMQLNILRQAALCPHTADIGRVISNAPGLLHSPTDFNPKLAACLSLVARIIAKGEQVMIGSPFRAFSQSLHERLQSAGVSSLLLDGQTSPPDRGIYAQGFKDGIYSTLIVGIAAMAEGNDFPNCSHLIQPSLSWAYDENEQLVNRVWRLTSPKPVTIYKLMIRGTIDERLLELFEEKSESAQLALDGLVLSDQVEELDLIALLRYSVRAFKLHAPTIDESAMEQQWESKLHARLARAEQKFQLLSRRPQAFSKKYRQPMPTLAH